MSVSSGTSFPGIAESTNGTGDAVGQLSSSVMFRGKTDVVVHKAQLLGTALACMRVISVGSPNPEYSDSVESGSRLDPKSLDPAGSGCGPDPWTLCSARSGPDLDP